MTSTKQKFIQTYLAFSSVDKTKRTTISHRIFGRTTKLDEVLGGAKMLTDSFDAGMDYFRNNWPEGAKWPEGVEGAPVSVLVTDGSLAPKVADGQSATKGAAQ